MNLSFLKVTNILKYLFPVPKPDSRRVLTFANDEDYISFRYSNCNLNMHVTSHMYTYMHVMSHMYTYMHVMSHMYTYMHVMSHMYTYMHVMSHM